MHFIASIFEEVSSVVLKLFDKRSLALIISEINPIFGFVSHSHNAFLVYLSYPIKEQLFSHKDKLLSLNSFFLSFINMSVPFSVVYELHLSL